MDTALIKIKNIFLESDVLVRRRRPETYEMIHILKIFLRFVFHNTQNAEYQEDTFIRIYYCLKEGKHLTVGEIYECLKNDHPECTELVTEVFQSTPAPATAAPVVAPATASAAAPPHIFVEDDFMSKLTQPISSGKEGQIYNVPDEPEYVIKRIHDIHKLQEEVEMTSKYPQVYNQVVGIYIHNGREIGLKYKRLQSGREWGSLPAENLLQEALVLCRECTHIIDPDMKFAHVMYDNSSNKFVLIDPGSSGLYTDLDGSVSQLIALCVLSKIYSNHYLQLLRDEYYTIM